MVSIVYAVATLAAAQALSAPAAACQPQRAHAPGLTRHALLQGGRERSYFVYVPAGLDSGAARPVVLDLHGSGSHPRQELALSGLDRAAERHGFLVVLPEAVVPLPTGGATWNVPPAPDRPDDVAFVREIVDDVARRLCIDPGRVYAVGFSGGGRLASLLACGLADRLAGVAAVGGLRHPETCAPARAVSILAFHGSADPINPYTGGGSAYWGGGVEAALRGWAAQYACDATPQRTDLAAGAVRIAFAGCDGSGAVTLYRLEGAGHVWPGSSLPLPEARFGAAASQLDATALILEAFGLTSAARPGEGTRAATSDASE